MILLKSKERREFSNAKFKRIMKDNLGSVCCNCGSTQNIHYHHIVPLSLGGTNKLTNIVPLCEECHGKAHGGRNMNCMHENSNDGRPRNTPPEGYQEIIHGYLHGYYGKKECKRLLGMNNNQKLSDKRYFRDYVNDSRIIVRKNFIDILYCDKNKPSKEREPERVIAYLKYEDGSEYILRLSEYESRYMKRSIT